MKKMLMVTACLMPFIANAAPTGSYISGGIGAEERAEFQSKKSEYNVEVKAALSTGHYLSNVKVAFMRDGQTALQGVTDGPFFFAKLAPGEYKVQAMHKGQTQTKTVSVTEGGMRQVMFQFSGDEPVVKGSADTVPEGSLTPPSANEPLPWNGPRVIKDPNVGDGVYFNKNRKY